MNPSEERPMRRVTPEAPEEPTDKRISTLLTSIAEELDLAMGDEDQVASCCRRLRDLLGDPPSPSDVEHLEELAALVAADEGTVSRPALDLLAEAAASLANPWPLLEILLNAEYEMVKGQALDAVCGLIETGAVVVDDRVLEILGDIFAEEDGLIDDSDAVARTTKALRTGLAGPPAKKGGRKSDPLVRGVVSDRPLSVRMMLAKLLDADGAKVAVTTSRNLLGAAARTTLKPYLDYTDAGYLDHLALAAEDGAAAVAASLKSAEAEFGEKTVRDVVSAVGWSRINLGAQFRRIVRVDVPGSLPLMVSPEQALIFDGVKEVVVGGECVAAVTHGCSPSAPGHGGEDGDPVGRFRALNIVHAELLGEIMDMAPLDRAKIERIVGFMDTVVDQYGALFASVSKEVAILDDVYGTIKRKVRLELDKTGTSPRINAEATRLVQMFEDPKNLGEVRTLHGLKRYLHQNGLRLGLKLVDTSRSPNHTVDIVVFDADGGTTEIQSIRFAEFETVCELDPDPWLIYPIRIVVEGFLRQMLYGQRTFPDVNAFVFGNEVHYYITFRNHPAFLRIDYSPPQRGGMIDLQYLGVSNYELGIHPGFDLEAIQLFFRRLGFDVKLDGTRLFVRYDKETSTDLGDLSAKAESLFRLAPHLMNVDWVVGSLGLDDEAMRRASEHWAERFALSGVLPTADILTADGMSVVCGSVTGPEGVSLETWDGSEPYRDRYSAAHSASLRHALIDRLEDLGVPAPSRTFADGREAGLLALERVLLAPLEQGLADGRIEIVDGGLRARDAALFSVEHPAERFAGLIASGGRSALKSVKKARPIAVLDRYTAFATVGYVGGMDIQRAELEVRGGTLTIYAARDDHGVVRMGLYVEGGAIMRTRAAATARWRYNTEIDGRLWSLLLSANYLAAAPDPVRDDPDETLEELRLLVRGGAKASRMVGRDDRRRLPGLAASPGRVVGRAVFETAGRDPEHLDGDILIAREIRPADAGHLLHAAGIVSAGGAVLSHAALLALQFGKPALVTDAEFRREKQQGRYLSFTTPIYEVEIERMHGCDVGLRRVVERRRDTVREGDLIVLDADAGEVQILGSDRDALALFEGFRMLDDACSQQHAASEAADVMSARALKLRARHVLEKTLGRLSDPVLASFAVEEILLGRSFSHVTCSEQLPLMSRVLDNMTVGRAARERMADLAHVLQERLESATAKAAVAVPTARNLNQVLGLRLRVIHAFASLDGAVKVLGDCGIDMSPPDSRRIETVGADVRGRLEAIRDDAVDELLDVSGGRVATFMHRHLLRRIAGIDEILGSFAKRRKRVLTMQGALERADEMTMARAASSYVLAGGACGYELNRRIGWKAANLAELARLLGGGVAPPWFVVTDRALNLMLLQPLSCDGGTVGGRGTKSSTLEDAELDVLGRDDADLGRKSALIRDLWESVAIPEEIAADVLAGYAQLGGDGFEADVALRSSSCDEDTEAVTRAGEYDTFLNVSGADSVRRHLKLTWAGLWTERALKSREVAGDLLQRPSGGVIVQLMVQARASGVMQTANVPAGDHGEAVINVGLGLGEGVVSGLVATDMITVVKNDDPEDRSLRINYVTNDKTTQVVFDKRRGKGTKVKPTLYHQRLRPALEYLELAELVSKALRLERAYGYPLDLEFAVEGMDVWLLQARPIGVQESDRRETLDRHPLVGPTTI